MPNKDNVKSLENIKEDIKDLSAMWIVDYRGLSVKQIQELRREVTKADAQMKVYKNTLMKIAVRDANLPDMGNELSGPNAFIFAHNDPVASAKAIYEFGKKNKDLTIKGGIMDGQIVDANQVESVAVLPSREQIYAMFAGAVSGVARGIATSINGVGRGIAQCVSQIADDKPKDADAA